MMVNKSKALKEIASNINTCIKLDMEIMFKANTLTML